MEGRVGRVPKSEEESRRENLARAAFVNDECVVARGGKLRGTRVRKGGTRRA